MYISFYLQWNVGVFCYLHSQWYVDVVSLHIISGTVVYLSSSSVVRRCIISSYHQWYGGISLFISSVVRWYISLHIISGTVVYLSSSSVVRRCTSLSTFSGTLVYFV